MNQPAQRRASRLIVIDCEGRILLLRHALQNGETFWATPGGGVEEGETFEEAALREASEELGVACLSVMFLWEQTAEFIYIDHPVRQQERFFRVESDLTALFANVDEIHRREGIVETKWWTPAEIESSKETIFPPDLAARVRTFSH